MHAGSSAEHPCVGSCEAVGKMSKSQKRRSRLRRTAAFKSSQNSASLRALLNQGSSRALGSIPIDISRDELQQKGVDFDSSGCAEYAEAGSCMLLNRLAVIEWKLDALLGNGGLWVDSWPDTNPLDCGISAETLKSQCNAAVKIQRFWRQVRAERTNFGGKQTGGDGWQSTHTPERTSPKVAVGDKFDKGKVEKCPDQCFVAPGDFRQLPAAAWSEIYDGFAAQRGNSSSRLQGFVDTFADQLLNASRAACGRCKFPVEKCCCQSVFCRLCMRRAVYCQCEVPRITSVCCNICGEERDDCNCVEPEWAQSELCSVGTWEDCEECKGIQNQSEIVQCDGKGCEFFVHSYCASKVVAPDGGEAWLCRRCSEAGNVLTDSDGSQSEPEDNGKTSTSNYEAILAGASYDDLMDVLQTERLRRERRECAIRELLEQTLVLAEATPDHEEMVTKARQLAEQHREAAAEVAEMQDDTFVPRFLQLHFRGAASSSL